MIQGNTNHEGTDPMTTIPQPVRSFARAYYRSVCMTGKGHDTLSYGGEWDTDNNTIIVRTILAETFIVPIAASWL